MRLNKGDIINRLVSEGIPARTATKTINRFLSIVQQSVNDGEDVTIMGFGTFTTKPWKGRQLHCISGAGTARVNDRRVPCFIPSQKFKDKINP